MAAAEACHDPTAQLPERPCETGICTLDSLGYKGMPKKPWGLTTAPPRTALGHSVLTGLWHVQNENQPADKGLFYKEAS